MKAYLLLALVAALAIGCSKNEAPASSKSETKVETAKPADTAPGTTAATPTPPAADASSSATPAPSGSAASSASSTSPSSPTAASPASQSPTTPAPSDTTKK